MFPVAHTTRLITLRPSAVAIIRVVRTSPIVMGCPATG
jgi:hypothetical protein